MFRRPLLLLFTTAAAAAQGTPSPVIQRQSGRDAESGIQYVLLSVGGKLVEVAPNSAGVPASGFASASAKAPDPQLVAQCSLTASGKYRFELLSNFTGSSSPLVFAPPWHPRPGELFPPHLIPVTVTMQFLGYTKVKPVRREGETLLFPSEWLRYATPGTRSKNMEEIMFYLQYLKALPTLRLSASGHPTVEFATAAWQQAIRADPVCHASSL